ncbi:MAG: cytochrome c oxidase assembly protein [Candidatus Saccharibacteria bacterium]|nr:cytochrome c oxidase assembly protein [Candidatus Saccharibacteria bacterium]
MHTHTSIPWWLFIGLGLVAALYCFAVVQQYRIFHYWSLWRTTAFVAGISLLSIAFSAPLEHRAHHSFTAHMVQHLLIGMFAPIGLVSGKPITLLLRTLPVVAARRITSVLNTKVCYWLVHPVTTLILNIGGMYALYLTPLYEISLHNTTIHYLVHWRFLVAGYLFVWSLIQADPIPHRPHYQFRISILFVSIAAHALLAKLIYAQIIPIDLGYPLIEIQTAAKMMYYGGDVAEIIIALLLFEKLYQRRKTN